MLKRTFNFALITTLLGGLLCSPVFATTYTQDESDLEDAISTKLDDISYTNSISKDKILDKAESCIKNTSEYNVTIENYSKDKSSYDSEGTVSFTVEITDADKNVYSFSKSYSLSQKEIYVYIALPELGSTKYYRITNSELIAQAEASTIDSKYLVTSNSTLISDSQLISGGWQTINNKKYYICTAGVAKGWQLIDGNLFHFDETTGVTSLGWNHIKGKWYFMTLAGVTLSGMQKVEGVTYYFTDQTSVDTGYSVTQKAANANLPDRGAMKTGWIKVQDVWYYFNDPNGAMVTGWKQIGNAWYYFDTTGIMLHDCTVQGYTLGSDGSLS